jgi:hypothetical protein
MASRRLLYFTAEARQLYRWNANGLDLEASFAADEAGVESFREFLGKAKGTHFYFVADISGEDFQEDQIPQLRGSDREAILQRRLAQRYRDTRLAAAFTLGNSATADGERRNERLLLASFTNAEQFGPWLDAIAAAGITLAGVYSVPLLAPALATQLGARAGHALIVSINSAGLRQSFIEDGKLRFARLERTTDESPQALAAFVVSETSRLVQYLSTLRVLPKDGAPVQVFAIAPAGQRATFEEILVSDQRLSFHTIGIEEAASKIGIKRLARDSRGEHLYLHLSVKRPPREQFAKREDRRAFYLWQLKRGIAAAGALGCVICAAYAGNTWLSVTTVRGQAATQARESETAASEYQRITSGFPVTQTTTDNLRATVTQFRTIANRTAWPDEDFVHVSRVLDRYPQLELDRFEWRVDREGNLGAAKPGAAAAAPAATAPAPAPATPGGAPASGTKPGADGDFVRAIQISGRVNATQRSDYRGITGQVQDFAQALRGNNAYRIVRTQLPFDVTPDSTLSGDIGVAETSEAPRFTILLARRMQ